MVPLQKEAAAQDFALPLSKDSFKATLEAYSIGTITPHKYNTLTWLDICMRSRWDTLTIYGQDFGP